MKKCIVVAVLLAAFIATPAFAKEGYYLGLYVPTCSITGDAGSGTSSESGWGLRLGNGFNRYFSFEGNYAKVKDLKNYAVDFKLNFPLTTLDSAQIMSLEPYALIGYDYSELGSSTTVKANGLQFGFGIELYLFKELSVNAGWTKSKITLDTTPKVDGDINTIDLGLIYHFI